MDFEHDVRWYPAQDLGRDKGGVVAAMVVFAAKRDGRVVSLEVSTGWFLHSTNPNDGKGYRTGQGAGFYIWYHSPNQPDEYWTRSKDDCPHLGTPCYMYVDALDAMDVFEVLVREGDEGVWRELEKRWGLTFGAKRKAS
jgi:hypothetical protein